MFLISLYSSSYPILEEVHMRLQAAASCHTTASSHLVLPVIRTLGLLLCSECPIHRAIVAIYLNVVPYTRKGLNCLQNHCIKFAKRKSNFNISTYKESIKNSIEFHYEMNTITVNIKRWCYFSEKIKKYP